MKKMKTLVRNLMFQRFYCTIASFPSYPFRALRRTAHARALDAMENGGASAEKRIKLEKERASARAERRRSESAAPRASRLVVVTSSQAGRGMDNAAADSPSQELHVGVNRSLPPAVSEFVVVLESIPHFKVQTSNFKL